MPSLTIKNIPDDMLTRLWQKAKGHHRSLQGELMAILEESVQHKGLSIAEVVQRIREVNPEFPQRPGTTDNCARCTDVVADILNGRNPKDLRAARGSITPEEFALDNHLATRDLLLDAAKDWRPVPDRVAIDKAMQATPPGSHARVWGKRKDGGHVFNVWNDGQRVWFIDGQTGRISWVRNGRMWEFDPRTGRTRPLSDAQYDAFELLLADF